MPGPSSEGSRLAEAYDCDAFGRVYIHHAEQAQCHGDSYCDLYDYLLCRDCFGGGTGTGQCAWADVYGSDGDVDENDFDVLWVCYDDFGPPADVVTPGQRSRSQRGGGPWL